VQKSHNVEVKIWLQSKEHKKTEYPSDNIQIYTAIPEIRRTAKMENTNLLSENVAVIYWVKEKSLLIFSITFHPTKMELLALLASTLHLVIFLQSTLHDSIQSEHAFRYISKVC
jgi:hypothetical protein